MPLSICFMLHSITLKSNSLACLFIVQSYVAHRPHYISYVQCDCMCGLRIYQGHISSICGCLSILVKMCHLKQLHKISRTWSKDKDIVTSKIPSKQHLALLCMKHKGWYTTICFNITFAWVGHMTFHVSYISLTPKIWSFYFTINSNFSRCFKNFAYKRHVKLDK